MLLKSNQRELPAISIKHFDLYGTSLDSSKKSIFFLINLTHFQIIGNLIHSEKFIDVRNNMDYFLEIATMTSCKKCDKIRHLAKVSSKIANINTPSIWKAAFWDRQSIEPAMLRS